MGQCVRVVGAGQAILGVFHAVFGESGRGHEGAFAELRAACRDMDRASADYEDALLPESGRDLLGAEEACLAAMQTVVLAGDTLAAQVYERQAQLS